MAHAGYEQLTLGFLDTASPYTLSLGGSSPLPLVAEPETAAAPEPPVPAAVTWRLAGERALAPSWKARAAENLAAIRLLQQIEQAGRPATAEEQAILSRFTGFGASELANNLFRRQGQNFAPAWAELGHPPLSVHDGVDVVLKDDLLRGCAKRSVVNQRR